MVYIQCALIFSSQSPILLMVGVRKGGGAQKACSQAKSFIARLFLDLIQTRNCGTPGGTSGRYLSPAVTNCMLHAEHISI